MVEYELVDGQFDAKELGEVEAILGTRLPQEYRRFLMERGTGRIRKDGRQDWLVLPDCDEDLSIGRFEGTRSLIDFLERQCINAWWPYMPSKSLPIASGPGVDWGIYYGGHLSGSVFALIHELGPEDGPIWWEDMNDFTFPYSEYVKEFPEGFCSLLERMVFLDD